MSPLLDGMHPSKFTKFMKPLFSPSASEKKSKRLENRRRTNINPNLTTKDIQKTSDGGNKSSSAPSTPATVVIPKPDYTYSCAGRIEHGMNRGVNVKWQLHDTENSLEEAIYPSLQYFDLTSFSDRRKQYQQLHGHNHSHLMKSPYADVSKSQLNQAVAEAAKAFVDLEPLPQIRTSETTAKWALEIGERTHVEKRVETIQDEINCKGEISLRKALKHSYVTELKIDHLLETEKKTLNLFGPGRKDPRLKRRVIVEEAVEEEKKDNAYYAGEVYKTLLHEQPGDRRGRIAQRLNKPTLAEIVHTDQHRALNKLMPKESNHMLEGVLYYRMKNEIRKDQECVAGAASAHSPEIASRAQSTQKSKRPSNLIRRQSSLEVKLLKNFSTKNDMHLSAVNEDPFEHRDSLSTHGFSVGGVHSIKTVDYLVSESDLTRVRRALHTAYTGFDAHVINNDWMSNTTENPYYISDNYNVNNPLSDADSISGTLSCGSIGMSPTVVMSGQLGKRTARDVLLLSQLKAGVIPEQFIKKSTDPNNIMVDLSNFGIGDVHGVCLGKSIENLHTLATLGLHNNRLTGLSLSRILNSLSPVSVCHLDLSYNSMHDDGAAALADFFKQRNVVKYLDISHCDIHCSDMDTLCRSWLLRGNCRVTEAIFSENKIGFDGSIALATYLSHPCCSLTSLDLSWNELGTQGGTVLAGAIATNTTLISLNLPANGLNDQGGQRLAASLATNKTIQDISLCQNNISNCSCFVFSKVLKGHPSMKRLDLSTNPLGEPGGRSLYRSILRGLSCFVIMKTCEFNPDDNIFDNSNPSSGSPYELDMSEPYKAAVLAELMNRVIEDPINYRFDSITYKETPRTKESQIQVIVANGEIVLKSSGQRWQPPISGTLNVHFSHTVVIPTLSMAAHDNAVNLLSIIVANGSTEMDCKKWLKLMCADLYVTTVHGQRIIDYLLEKRIIGIGGLTKLDVFASIWSKLLDTENIYDLLCRHLEKSDRRDLVYALTFEKFRFNWLNPTSHWRLNLADRVHRAVMINLMAINYHESEYSKNSSGRGDTSQLGNWFNIRNSAYTKLDKDFVADKNFAIDKEFIANLPYVGTVEFDFVSTSRPYIPIPPRKQAQSSSDTQDSVGGAASSTSINVADDTVLDEDEEEQKKMAPSISTATLFNKPSSKEKLVSDDDFYGLLDQMGLSARQRACGSAALFALSELQIASTKYYFTVVNVIAILDTFVSDYATQSKVVICMFSRIWDLHNFEGIMRGLETKAQQMVISRLGCLNIMNPLKPTIDLVISLHNVDNRILVHCLLEMSAAESGDQIKENPQTGLSVMTLYGSMTRLLTEQREEVMKFVYCDVGERSTIVSWPTRIDRLKRFLIGDVNSHDRSMYRVVVQYRELDAAGKLSRGPIEFQHSQYLKNMKSSATKKVNSIKAIHNLMKSNSKSVLNQLPAAVESAEQP